MSASNRIMDKSEIASNLKHHGTFKMVEDIAFRSLNKFVFFRVLKAMKVETINPEFLKCNENFRGLFLPEGMLRNFARNPEYELSDRFLDQAIEKGDECYGFLDGDVLAAYGWYSNKPTEAAWPGLVIHFNDQYIYMYKGFTHFNYRGHRLHAIGKTMALADYLARGYRGLVSYAEWNNFDSLRSNYRMGCTDFGNIYVAGGFNHYFVHSDVGCGRNGFGLERVRPVSERAMAVSWR